MARTAQRAALAQQALDALTDGEIRLGRRYYYVLCQRAKGRTLKAIAADDWDPPYTPYTRERIRQLENEALNRARFFCGAPG